ncbi:MAG: efflux RND transporter permease subunit, partial [Akkermansiaceae bacterium]|nr:efflux RND transporter permease subunit [Akkermansiaceae bacterium]
TEVEQGVILPVEEAVQGIEGIRETQSESSEGRGMVMIELVPGTDRMRAYQDINQAVNRIRTFPDDIEEPDVRLQSRDREVMNLVLYGEVDVWSLRQLSEQLRDQLLAEDSITQVSLDEPPDYVTHVEIPRDRLRELGVTIDEIARIIRASSEDIPAGSVRTDSGEILLRLKERKQYAEQFAGIEIISSEEGTALTLGDIATITDGFEETGFHSRFNQTPSSQLKVFRIGDQSPLDIAEAVERVMADFEATLPPGVKWRIDSNRAEDFRERTSLLIENGLMAIVIVMAILALFLDLRLAFWVMMGMSTSFIGGMMLMPLAGVSISMISMFAFLIVLGIVVDDAIVVGENIHEHRQEGMSAMQAAIAGARDIAVPVTFSILTNIVAFIPLFFVPGETGQFWKPIPYVVTAVLLVSLVEALFILPAHLGHSRIQPKRTQVGSRIRNAQKKFAKSFDHFVNTRYRRLLRFAMRFRYVTVTLALAILVVALSYSSSSHMGMILMPEVPADEIEAGIDLPVGVTPRQASEVAMNVTAATRRMFDEHELDKVAEGIKTNVRGGDFIDVEIVMRPPDQRDMTAAEVIDLWRNQIGDIPGVDQITFEAESGPGGWRPDITVSLSHSDIEVLEKASKDLLVEMEKFESSRDVRDDYRKGKTQYDFRLRPEGRALGLTAEDIGRQLRDSFFGALSLRQLRGTNEVEIRVKLPEDQRQDLHHLRDLVIQTPTGTEVPLFDVVEMTRGEAFTSIKRRDGRRVINIECDVEPKRNMNQVITSLRTEVLPELRRSHPGITWTFEGSESDMREATSALQGGFLLALCVIYSLLAVVFRSYLQPLIVLLAIPFGIVGAVIGHILLGFDLSVISLMGVIALSGVVVNDSLIMIDYANKRREDEGVFQAIEHAGTRRFRPIILTTLTTFGGLTPIILERSMQAQYLIPMAISLGFGIVFATAIILLLVPCLYLILDDLKQVLPKRQ